MDRLGSLTFVLHFLYQFWIAAWLVCSFCESMAGTLSIASTAVLSAKVALVDSGEAGSLQCIAGIIIAL
jgi:hypothetical protein